jgi:hypothetical protein
VEIRIIEKVYHPQRARQTIRFSGHRVDKTSDVERGILHRKRAKKPHSSRGRVDISTRHKGGEYAPPIQGALAPNLYEYAPESRPDSGVHPGIFELTAAGLLAGQGGIVVGVIAAVTLLVCLFVFYGGVHAIRNGFDQYRRSARVRNTPTEDVESLAMGRTELYGEVRPGEDALDQPFADGECVWVEWEITERSSTNRPSSNDGPSSSGNSSWGLVERDVEAVPFDLDDGTGRVRVTDPQAAFDGNFEARWPFLLSDDRETAQDVGTDEPVPDPIREFCEARDIDVRGDGKRRYAQTLIDVGSEVYAYGEARRRRDPASGEPEVELRPEETTDDLVLSDTEPSELSGKFRKGMVQGLVVGLGAGILGLGGLWLWYQNYGPLLLELLGLG